MLEADDYITKPFNKAELLYRIQNKLNLIKKLQQKFSEVGYSKYNSTNIESKEDKFLNLIGRIRKKEPIKF